MKRTIPFDLFGEKQELCFGILKLKSFELAMGKGIQQIIRSGDEGINFCLTALPFCLEKLSEETYAEKINEYLENGGMLNEISKRIIHAIFILGIFGEEGKKSVMEIYYPNIPQPKVKAVKN